MKILTDKKKVAIYYKDNEIKYRDLIINIKKIGKVINLEAQKNIMIFMENRPELLYSFFAIWEAKSTCVCIDVTSSAEELAYFIENSDSTKIFTSKLYYEKVKEAFKFLNRKSDIVVVDDINLEEIKLEGLREENIFIEAPELEDVILLLYTSGTTGKPKGVMLTFDNLLCNLEALDMHQMFNENDIIIALLPLHHILPLLGSAILPLINSSSLVFLDDMSSSALIETMKKYKITMIVAVPRLWEMIHKKIMTEINSRWITKFIFKVTEKINSEKFSKKIFKKVLDGLGGNLKIFVSGGSKLKSQLTKDFKTLGIKICEGYGMSETTAMVAYTPMDDIRPGCAGRVIKDVEVKIADDNEILVKGRNVMKGYYKNQKATAEIIDKDGWLHTGDLGYLEGIYLFITGRKKEMIVLSNGKNINPIEIEEKILKEITNVAEVVVLEYNSNLTAVIKPDFEKIKLENISNIYENLKSQIIYKYNKKVSDYKKILDVKIINEDFPKTRIGKIRRFLIPDMLAGKLEKKERKEEPNFEEYNKLKKYIVNLKEKEVYCDSHIELDLAMDSLDMVELLHFIELNFGLKEDNLISKNPIILNLAEYIREHKNEEKVGDLNWHEIINKDINVKIPNSTTFSSFIKSLCSIFFNSYFKVNIINKEILNSKPAIYIGNHQSFIDGLLLNHSFSKEIFKNTYYLATIKHFRNSIIKKLANSSNIILIDKNKDVTETIQIVAKILKQGKNVVIFPEGARTRNGNLNQFKKTFAILAKELKVDLQTFVIQGAYEVFLPDKKFPKRGDIEIKFLERIKAQDLKKLSYDQINQKVFDLIYNNLN